MPVTTPIDVDFGEDTNKELDKFVDENLRSLLDSTNILRTSTIPEWRRLYKGIPAEKERNWPWPNASNVVIQLIGENCDILKARILGTVYEILPLWSTSLLGEWGEEEQGDEQKRTVEDFMNYVGLEPTELDLYRVESLACNDIVQFGTVVVKSPWETDTEELVVTASSTGRGAPAGKELIKYDGPRPEKLLLEDWGASEKASTLEKADFKYHYYPLKKQQMEMRFADGRFKLTDEQKEKLMNAPDRLGSDTNSQIRQEEKGITPESGHQYTAEWDIYECWFWFFHNGKKYRIVYVYHKQTKIKLRAFFNFYPNNDEPWELGRLGYNDDGLRGFGFCEMLKYYQEEVTTGHNQRCDNRTLANTSIIFAGRNPRVDSNLSLYPGAVLPLDATEAQIAQMGREYTGGVEEERLTRELAAARAGVDPPSQGAGAGSVNKKGAYSAMGTFALMQAGNRRVNINITDFRYMHLKLGRRFLRQYAEFGIGERLKLFGKAAPLLKKALENVKQGRLELPIKAANASINKEVEKQNDMLLSQIMQRHQQSIGQLMQGISNPAIPEEMMEYAIGSILAQSSLMEDLFRNFGKDNVTRLLPEQTLIRKIRSQRLNGQQNNPAAAVNPAAEGIQGTGGQEGLNSSANQNGGVPVNPQVLSSIPRTM